MGKFLDQWRRELIALNAKPHIDLGQWQFAAGLSVCLFIGSMFFPDYSGGFHPKFVAGGAFVVLCIAGWKLFDLSDRQRREFARRWEITENLRNAGFVLRYGDTELSRLDAEPSQEE